MNEFVNNDIDVDDAISSVVFFATQRATDERVVCDLMEMMDELTTLLRAANLICMDEDGNFSRNGMSVELGEDDMEYSEVSAIQNSILHKMARVQLGIEALLHKIDVSDDEWDTFVYCEAVDLRGEYE